jgi:hypothetical protein
MKIRSQFYTAVILLVLSALACSFTPNLGISDALDSIDNEVMTTINKIVIEEGDLPALYEAINPGVVAIRALSEEGGNRICLG